MSSPGPSKGSLAPRTPTKLARKPHLFGQSASPATKKTSLAPKKLNQDPIEDAGNVSAASAKEEGKGGIMSKDTNGKKQTQPMVVGGPDESSSAPEKHMTPGKETPMKLEDTIGKAASHSKEPLAVQDPTPMSDSEEEEAVSQVKTQDAEEAQLTADEKDEDEEEAQQDVERPKDKQTLEKATEEPGDSNSRLGESDYINVSDEIGDSHEEVDTPNAEKTEGEAQESDEMVQQEAADDDDDQPQEKSKEVSSDLHAAGIPAKREGKQRMEDNGEDSDAEVEQDVQRQLEGPSPNLVQLKGLEVDAEGLVHNRKGAVVGKLVEGDAEDLAGYPIDQNGEILDEDGDLVGRCELMEQAERQADHVDEDEDDDITLPAIEILEGLSCDAAGNILNEDGDTVGQIVEGEPRKLKGRPIQADGRILDDKGKMIGLAEVHPDIPDVYRERGRDDGSGVEIGNEADDVHDEEAANKSMSEAPAEEDAEIEEDLPSIQALEGRQVNSEGEVIDEEGNVLGELVEGKAQEVKGLKINDQGGVVDEEGKTRGRVELAEGARQVLAASTDAFNKHDLRILEGLKVNKKGKVLDEEGEAIGELIDGDVRQCAGQKVNDKGEVITKEGEILGRVKVTPGDAADEATRQLFERLGELEADSKLPRLEILEGLKVNKKGRILNEDGEPIGELVDGDIACCAGKKCNAHGEVIDKNGKAIGRVKTLSCTMDEIDDQSDIAKVDIQQAQDEAIEDQHPDEDAGAQEEVNEAEGDGVPPLSTLGGLKVNKAGKLFNNQGAVVGELIEGDAKKLSKSGSTCDAEGQFWDNKGHIIGRAKTVPIEDAEGEAVFAGLEGLTVNKSGFIEDENGNVVGIVTEGDAKKLVGRAVDEDGDIVDKKGTVVGHAERYEEPEAEAEAEPEAEAIDLSFLAGKPVNKQGNVIGDEGVPIARLIEGNLKECSGKKLDKEGRLWNDRGQSIGRVELIPEHEREAKPEGPFAGLEGLRVVKDGKVADQNENLVGTIVEGNAKRLIGLAVDEDGDVIDKYGNVKGHAEPLPEEQEPEAADLSLLDGKKLNKQGFVVNEDGIPIGRLVQGNVKELAGRRCDEQGHIHGDTGKVVGRCELIPESERVSRAEGPFAGYDGLHVIKDGWVADENDNVVGRLIDGNPKRLVGHTVDEDGDIIDKYGNVKGHAEPYEEEEEIAVDLSRLAGCTVNKAGNIVNDSGTIIGRVAEGTIKNLVGRKVDGHGQIWDSSGKVVGRAELAQGEDTKADGPFAGFDFLTVVKDGNVVTASGDVVGRVADGDVKKLVGHHPDEDGDITDRNGNLIGRAERWEPEEKERRINPMSGLHVNKEGEVRDQNGDLIGRLTMGDIGHCAGLEIDDNGYVIDNDGTKVGEVTLLENIAAEEEEVEEEMTEEQRRCHEEKELANKMANICQDTLERVQPICKQINESIDACERTPEKERDEKALVDKVAPLIEEASRILEECNGALRALDPDGHIAAEARARSKTRDATPEEYRLADLLKELTGTVVKCIDDAKKRLENLPHAKKKLNPLWVLLTEPLFQILAAVGLLLTGVLGLVGQLLSLLGLGGLVNGLLGGLGIKKLLGSLGLGDVLGGKGNKGKGKGIVGNLPIVGGLLGKRSD